MISPSPPLGVEQSGENMSIGINGDGWREASMLLGNDEIVERMGLPESHIHDVLRGAIGPDSRFIAAALLALPFGFSALFVVRSMT